MSDEIKLNPAALEALKENQRQLDDDGVEVGVSRQALDEAIAFIDAMQPEWLSEKQVLVLKERINKVKNFAPTQPDLLLCDAMLDVCMLAEHYVRQSPKEKTNDDQQ